MQLHPEFLTELTQGKKRGAL